MSCRPRGRVQYYRYYLEPDASAGVPSQICDHPEQGGDAIMPRRRTTSSMIMLACMLGAIFAIPGLQAGEWGPFESEGTVLGIMADQGLILLDHEPIRAPGYFMGPMEMPFRVSISPDQWPQSGRSYPFSRQRGEKIAHRRHQKTAVSAPRTAPHASADPSVRGHEGRSRAHRVSGLVRCFSRVFSHHTSIHLISS